jgi:hypothetical protein
MLRSVLARDHTTCATMPGPRRSRCQTPYCPQVATASRPSASYTYISISYTIWRDSRKLNNENTHTLALSIACSFSCSHRAHSGSAAPRRRARGPRAGAGAPGRGAHTRRGGGSRCGGGEGATRHTPAAAAAARGARGGRRGVAAVAGPVAGRSGLSAQPAAHRRTPGQALPGCAAACAASSCCQRSQQRSQGYALAGALCTGRPHTGQPHRRHIY